MRRVVFALRPGERGHINASLYLARQLRVRGCDVRYAADGDDADYLAGQGFPCTPMPAAMPTTDALVEGSARERWAAWLQIVGADLRSLRLLRDLLAKSGDSIADLAPDLVIADETLWWLPAVASLHGLKVVCLATTLPARPPKRRAARMTLAAARGWIADLAHRATYYALALLYGVSPLQLVASGRAPRGLFRNVWHCWDYRCVVETLVACPEEFDLPDGPARGDLLFVEPCIDRDRIDGGVAQAFPPPGRPRILVSMGSVAQPGLPTFLEALRQVALARPEWSFLAAGDAADPALGPLPANLRLHARLDQLRLLPDADLLVCHCGLNSVKEAIAASVPILGFPIRRDQPAVAARVVHHGLGITGDFRRVTPESLESAISQMLASSAYATSVARLSRRFAEIEAAAPGVEWLMRRIG